MSVKATAISRKIGRTTSPPRRTIEGRKKTVKLVYLPEILEEVTVRGNGPL